MARSRRGISFARQKRRMACYPPLPQPADDPEALERLRQACAAGMERQFAMIDAYAPCDLSWIEAAEPFPLEA